LLALFGSGRQRAPCPIQQAVAALAKVPCQHGGMWSRAGLLEDARGKMVQRQVIAEGQQAREGRILLSLFFGGMGRVTGRAPTEFAI